MKFFLIFSFLLLQVFSYAVRNPDFYYYSVDLNKVSNDKVDVELSVPAITKDEISFLIPAIVPGTYAIYDFGRFITNFRALDKDGKEMPVEFKPENTWVIKDAKKLDKLSYTVEDTWDTNIKDRFVFEPAGTNIEDGKNYVLNNHGFFGYFEDMKFRKFEISVTHPAGFYGSTGIKDITSSGNIDKFVVSNYMDLVDAPIMYCNPDTAIIQLGSTKVLISVYSPNKRINSKQVASSLKATLEATRNYLGGNLPVDKYAFLFYFTDKEGGSGASGALEHSYSSFYFLPEAPFDILKQTIRDVTAHEFFHIITPLTIHSEEIGNFSYNKPNMSRHLWLYEGCTEYAAAHVQVKNRLITMKEYLTIMRGKINNAADYKDDLPFTVMSKDVLDKYEKEYGNVYEKGALIGMCLDIQLRYYSKGAYGIQDLMRDLGKKYGVNVSFNDDSLIPQIVKLTYPEIGVFFKDHVDGGKPLPFKTVFEMVGIDYYDRFSYRTISYGGVDLGYNQETKRIVIVDTASIDEIGRSLGFRMGDELVSFYGKKLTPDNVRDVITEYLDKAKDDEVLKVIIMRKDEKGKMKKIKVKTRVRQIEVVEKNLIFPSKKASEEQLKIRKAWIGDSAQ